MPIPSRQVIPRNTNHMALPLETTSKTRIIRRAKALGLLLLPFVAAGIVLIAASLLMRRLGVVPGRGGAQTGDGAYSVEVKKGFLEHPAAASSTTELTTYTITGTY